MGRQFSREFAASIRSLKKFGAPLQSDGITPATFTQERTDLSDRHSTGSDRHSHAGIEFPAAWKDRVAGTFFGVSVHFISLDHLIANKQARGRSTDLEQLKHISKTQTRKKPGLRKSECEVPPQITPDNQESLKSCALWPALACRPRRSFRSCSIRASQRSKDCAPGEKIGSKNSSCAPMSLHPAMSSLIWSIVPEKIIRLSPAGFSLISRLARTTMANDNGSLKMDV